ncbi:hypothetical protein ACVWYJ_002294 [Bradyrhizobium sp. USDA 4471]
MTHCDGCCYLFGHLRARISLIRMTRHYPSHVSLGARATARPHASRSSKSATVHVGCMDAPPMHRSMNGCTEAPSLSPWGASAVRAGYCFGRHHQRLMSSRRCLHAGTVDRRQRRSLLRQSSGCTMLWWRFISGRSFEARACQPASVTLPAALRSTLTRKTPKYLSAWASHASGDCAVVQCVWEKQNFSLVLLPVHPISPLFREIAENDERKRRLRSRIIAMATRRTLWRLVDKGRVVVVGRFRRRNLSRLVGHTVEPLSLGQFE